VTNGARPPAPFGGHSSQVGALLDRAVVPVVDEVPGPEPPADVLVPVPAAFDRPPPLEVDPVGEIPAIVPVAGAGLVCVVLAAAVAVAVGNVTAP
jgi:hypothetical protein